VIHKSNPKHESNLRSLNSLLREIKRAARPIRKVLSEEMGRALADDLDKRLLRESSQKHP
jgi:UDP:flavonoid glycosyltransferase YjiC (YdhE family)